VKLEPQGRLGLLVRLVRLERLGLLAKLDPQVKLALLVRQELLV